MKKDFVDKMEKVLIEQRKELISSLTGQTEQLSQLSQNVDAGDDVDIASDTIDRTLLNSLGEADQRRLAMIERALERVTRGTYGQCVMCGKDIPEPRLEAIPYAALCIGCQSSEERRNR